MALASVGIREGSDKNIATHSIFEDSTTKHLERVVINDSTGADIMGTQSSAAITTDTNGTVIGFLRGLVKIFNNVWNTSYSALNVKLATVLPGHDALNNVVVPQPRYTIGTERSADGNVCTGQCVLNNLVIDCTTAGTLVLRDGTSTSGTVIKTLNVPLGITNLSGLNWLFADGVYTDFGTMVGTVNGGYSTIV